MIKTLRCFGVCLILLNCFVPVQTFAQSRQISGTVTSTENKEPAAGVMVTVKGTTRSTITDEQGKYRLTVDNNALSLVFTSYSFLPLEVEINGKNVINAQLKPAIKALDDVVIIGYQPMKRGNMMAASSSVGAKELKDNPINNAAEALQGRLAGVQITMSEGMPGADAVVNIRGRGSITQSGDPLYIVDGIPTDNALSVLNIQDVESIDVLKDAASTAIYGSRGANGVVVITTKGGRNTNGRTIVSYNMYYGIQKLAKKLDMMSPYDFVLYQYERAWWTGDTSGNIKKYIRIPTNYDTLETYRNYDGIDWQDRTMGRNALQSSHNVSVSGGNDKTTYNLSLTANKQDGVLILSDMERKIVNFKLDHKANSRFRFGFNVRYTDQLVNGAGTSDASGAGSNRLRQYTRYRPLLLPGQEEDTYDPDLDLNNAGNGFNILNPVLLAEAETRRRYTTLFNMNGYVQIRLMKNISFRSTAAYNISRVRNRLFDDTLTNNAKSYARLPIATISNAQGTTITNSNVLTYSNDSLFKSRHAINVLVGQEIQQSKATADNLTLRYFPVGTTADKAFANLQLAPQTSPDGGILQLRPSSSEVPTTLASFFSTIDYNYDQRYFAKFTLRADGTSIFSSRNRWGYFPSGALAWRVSREKFFSSEVITDLRLRYSYGTAGNNRITPFSFLTQYMSPSNQGYTLNGVSQGIFSPANLGNEDLIWESQVSQNVGADVSLWNNRVNITVDAYSNQSKDLLLAQTIPSSSGYTTQFQNIGSTRNRGIETQISANIIDTKNFTWGGSFNISFNKNKITSLGPNQQILRNSGWFSSGNFPADYILKVGDEVGTMYGYVNDGYYTLADFDNAPYNNPDYPEYTTQYTLKKGIANASGILANPLQPGSPKYRDMNGDGIITSDSDRVVIGRAQPKFFGGFSQTFTYKGFDLTIFVNYSYGGDVFNANKLEYSNAYGSELNMLSSMNGRWKMIDANGKSIQRVINNTVAGADPATIEAVNRNAALWFPSTSINGFYSQSFGVEDGSYIRINNVSLGYNFPKRLLSKIKVSSLRVYATANNLALFTRYTGYDPDANARRSDPTTPGVDYSAYPRARTYVFGLNLTL